MIQSVTNEATNLRQPSRDDGGFRGVVLAGFAGALSAPEVAWSLCDAGFRPVFFARRGRVSPLSQSNFAVVREITAPEESLEAATTEIGRLMAEFQTDATRLGTLLPLDDSSAWLCSRVTLPNSWRLAGPCGEQVDYALDKWKQIAAAREVGFDVPESRLAADASEIAGAAFPLILRSSKAVIVQGDRFGRGGNWICADEGEAKSAFAAWGTKGSLLVQPYLHGVGEGIFGIASKGGVTALSSHRRLRMMNPHGSGSSACVSQPVPESLRGLVERFIRKIGWTGIFMIELLRDEAGRYWFVEFNGRSWGSMALARRQGLEYPAWAARLAIDPNFEPPSTGGPNEEIECRNLGREIMHLLFVLRGAKSRAVQTWPAFGTTLREMLRLSRPTTCYNWRKDDWRVLAADTWLTIREQVFRPKNGAGRSREMTVACHVHSEWSYDAKWKLDELALEFGRRGYRVLMMTEHDRGFTEKKWRAYREACAKASTEEVLVVPGMEYSDASNTIHVLVWGCESFLGENLPTSELLRSVREHGGIAVLAHPARRAAWRLFDPTWAADLLGIELWNRKTDGWAPSRSALPLLKSSGLRRFVGLDFHDRRQFFPLSMKIVVSGEVNETTVLDEFRAGRAQAWGFGRPAGNLLAPAAAFVLSAAEKARRSLAAPVRELRRWRNSLVSKPVLAGASDEQS